MAITGYPVHGRTVLVTGAARGIGAATARRLAARGARVALVGLEPERLEATAAACGPDAAWFEADVTDTGSVDDAVAAAVERFGGIDVAIANAGIASAGLVRSIDPAAFERTIQVNLLGVWRTVYAALPHVVERRGYVLNIASLAAAAHAPGMAAYAASKAGVEAFSNSLRLEMLPHGVGVGVGYFSWIATDMVAGTDTHPVGGRMRAGLRGPLAKTHPVSAAAEAIVDGIERRGRWVVVPGWVRALLVMRGLVPLLLERDARQRMPEMEALTEAELARRGAEALSAPVGAGGQADARARAHATP